MEGIWADADGKHTYVGDMSVPINSLQYTDVEKFLSNNSFEHNETTAVPGDSGEKTFEHRDGRQVTLRVQLSEYGGFPVLDGARGVQHGSPLNINTVGDLVNFVSIGRETFAPEKGGEEVSDSITPDDIEKAIIEKAKREWISKPMGPYSSWAECKEAGKTDAYCGYLYHHASPEGHGKKDDIAKRFVTVSGHAIYVPDTGEDHGSAFRVDEARKSAMVLLAKFLHQKQVGTAANPAGVQNPVAGGSARMEDAQTAFNQVRFENGTLVQASDIENWNLYRESELPMPDEIGIIVDPTTGEINLIEYEYAVPQQQMYPAQFQPDQYAQSYQDEAFAGPAIAPGGTQITPSIRVSEDRTIEQPRQTRNFIRIQQRPPKDFGAEYRTIDMGEGRKGVYGRTKSGKQWAMQTLLFPKESNTRESASAWAKEHGFKVGTAMVEPGHVKADGMVSYSGGPAAPPAMGTKGLIFKPKLHYNEYTNKWEQVNVALFKGMEVVMGDGLTSAGGTFCDICHTAIRTFVVYKDMRVCKLCVNRGKIPAPITKESGQ